MSEIGESIIKGMEEALAFAKGEKNGAVVHGRCHAHVFHGKLV